MISIKPKSRNDGRGGVDSPKRPESRVDTSLPAETYLDSTKLKGENADRSFSVGFSIMNDYLVRFKTAQSIMRAFEENTLFNSPLARWALPSEKGLPRRLMGLTLREVLQSRPEDILNTKGFGTLRFTKLVVVIERAIQEICSQHVVSTDLPRQTSDHDSQMGKAEVRDTIASSDPLSPNIICNEDNIENNEPTQVRYEQARSLYSKLSECSLGHQRLSKWVLPSDTHIPTRLVALPLSTILNKTYMSLLQTTGPGESTLRKLVVVIERAIKDIATTQRIPQHVSQKPESNHENRFASQASPAAPCNNKVLASADPEDRGASLTSLAYQRWVEICNCITRNGLEHYPLGRFPETLAALPLGLWNCRLSDFLTQSHSELIQLRGHGEQRTNLVVNTITRLAELLEKCPTDTHLRVNAAASKVNQVNGWLQGILHSRCVPDADLLYSNIMWPLLQQIEIDLGQQITEMVKRRLGLESGSATLQDIAEQFGLSRERVRQLTARATKVMKVRWQEGRHLLNALHNSFRSLSDAAPQIALIKRTYSVFFDAELDCQTTRDEVMQEWNTAGRNKETPMSENQIYAWLAGLFPELAPSEGVKWITSDSLFVQYEGRRLYFSNDDCDRILHHLYQTNRAAPIHELVDSPEREHRNLRMKLLRDLRFTEDEDHFFMPTELYGFSRDSIGWHTTLEAAESNSRIERTFLSVESIVAAALGGFAQAKIFDVTVWGFHRFVNEQLKLLYNAKLPKSISPFILGDTMIRQSGKKIRAMRRRRLRWDSSFDTTNTAKGKRGWVDFVVSQQTVPIVIYELPELLREFYQDYEPSAIDQLNLDNDEDGVAEHSVTMHSCIAHKLPAILVPDNWSLDQARDNVSPGVKLAVVRAISLVRDNRISLNELKHLPWFVQLIQRNSYGASELEKTVSEMHQNRENNSNLIQQTLDFREHQSPDIEPNSSSVNPRFMEPKKNIDDLLKRFL